uniref:PREDICTED MOLECULAR CHAPERONE DISTANTLY RELATED TO HSP70-F OLD METALLOPROTEASES n=1 Tax=Methanopyrus kandleri (strain AV19 / DSM 6324 / JCM 9639 / NBRC 100938) TaxID=190192 RepID=UPI0003C73A51|nr:Chain A, PREDICTED MOLECULAR CHAPERONE DISTANTLY RELATED TO HSP70-F OLD METALLOPROTEASES [Methanopyrus kandleri AV19]4BGA_B Chain B, PREDICTED MOLECULAR CHAPERONE DISTANTLY RELATED TO HSP70-F OLD METALLOPROTEASES [Methanopyrus kandleri AV19]4BGA_C Chain C, PREDICTED MOLECULAR CHAPERONE DISTANTLY RELATED TO HSP70-F OLD METALLOPROTEASES [Methanopyrus kandleri AV19]4BGA_D Chain D, PREDICTED MOLECULAR CHAPERONE DISTANTLY RELATED TO HSP70-F OLD METALLOPROTEASES [Methanopyrus kandleri AV19]4BGB_A 
GSHLTRVLGIQLGNTGTDYCVMNEDGDWEIVAREEGVFGKISCVFTLEESRRALREEIAPRVIERVRRVNPDLAVVGTIVDELGLILGPMIHEKTGVPTLAVYGDPWGAPDGDAVGAPYCVAEEYPNCVHVDVGAMAVVTPIRDGRPDFGDAVVSVGTFPLDLAARELLGKEYDEGGKKAAEGEVDENFRRELRSVDVDGKPVFGRVRGSLAPVPPEQERVLRDHIRDAGAPAEDVLRTLVELVAETIVINAAQYDMDLLVLSGGGVKNELLKRRVSELWEGDVSIFAGEELEARGLCLLGLRYLEGEPVPALPCEGGTGRGGKT